MVEEPELCELQLFVLVRDMLIMSRINMWSSDGSIGLLAKKALHSELGDVLCKCSLAVFIGIIMLSSINSLFSGDCCPNMNPHELNT